MEFRLRYLPFSALRAGMLLGRPLQLTQHGRVTLRLPAGHQLSEASLAQLQAHQAEYACIAEEDLRDEAQRAQDTAQQAARLQQIFAPPPPDNVELAAFFNALLAYRSR